ncbi:MAG: ComEC/Rec2 family competence protein [Firmicutes bacterium]|nr:ComEC/Rec2 family competence protein [Bacillota bacterium]
MKRPFKIFNFRPIFVAAVACLVGAGLGHWFFENLTMFLIISIVVLAGSLPFCFIGFVRERRLVGSVINNATHGSLQVTTPTEALYKLSFEINELIDVVGKNRKILNSYTLKPKPSVKVMRFIKRWQAVVVICTFFGLLGGGMGVLRAWDYYATAVDGRVVVVGTVTEMAYENDDSLTVVLRDVSFDGVRHQGLLNLGIYGAYGEHFEIENLVGNTLTFETRVRTETLRNSRGNTAITGRQLIGVKFQAFASAPNIEMTEGKLNIFETIKFTARQNIFAYVDDPNIAGVIYATIFADGWLISQETRNTFGAAGAAHLLAVSGLHIGILCGIVLFVLNLLKAGRKTKFWVASVFMFMYVLMCGFVPSLVRSYIMFQTMLFASLLGKKGDSLNNLSLACLIILILNPLAVFSAGFILSFGCLFAIVCWHSLFYNKLRETKYIRRIPKKLISSFSINVVTTLGIVAMMAYAFGEFHLISIISNLVIIPLFVVSFVASLAAVLLTLIWSGFGFVFYVAESLHWFTNMVSGWFGFIEHITIFTTASLIVLWVIIVFVLGRFVVMNNKVKLVATSCLVVVFFVSSILITVPIIPTSAGVYALSTGGNILTTSAGKSYIVAENTRRLNHTLRVAHFMRYQTKTIIFYGDVSERVEEFILERKDYNFIIFKNVVPKKLESANILAIPLSTEIEIRTRLNELEFIAMAREGSEISVASFIMVDGFVLAFIPRTENEYDVVFLNQTGVLDEADAIFINRVYAPMRELEYKVEKTFINIAGEYEKLNANVPNSSGLVKWKS